MPPLADIFSSDTLLAAALGACKAKLEFRRIEGAEHAAAAAADPEPRLIAPENQPIDTLLHRRGSVRAGRLRTASGMRVIMAEDRPTRLPRHARSAKMLGGIEEEGALRIGSRVGDRNDLFDHPFAPKKEAANLAPAGPGCLTSQQCQALS